ncbi:MAG: MFS transporter [Phycisphaerae bacterium]|nr:MFS transporter [Phycisphaerae bacterium]
MPRERILVLWQIRAFFSMAVLYLFYYFGKKNLGPATRAIEETFSLSHSQFGWVMTAFTLTYALGQFINGFLGDRYNPKTIMLVGAIGGVIANVLFGFSGSLLLFIVIWASNGYFSSMGWAPGCRILCNWFPERQWGWWMGLYNFFPYFGGALVAPVAAWSVQRYGWRGAFLVSPAFLLGMAGLFALLGRGSPESVGLQIPWRSRRENRHSERIGLKEYRRAFAHRRMAAPYLVAFGANGIRWGLLNWNIMILQTPVAEGGFGLPLVKAGFVASLVDWGGMFFAVTLGVLSDRLFGGRRWHTILLGMVGTAGALLVLAQGASLLEAPMGVFWLCVVTFVAGGLIQGIHTPLFCLPGDILGQRLSGTGTGIMDGWMYVGAALAGFPLGWWFDAHGLTAGIALLGVLSLLFGLLAIGIRR